jgi:hypothetical protein
LSEAETAEKLSELLEQRRGFYQNAHLEIRDSGALEELYLLVNQ